MSELKPCPMCGTKWVGFETSEDSTWVECGHCHTSSEMTYSQGAAREAWNNRPYENKLKAEAVREAMKLVVTSGCGKNKTYIDGFTECDDQWERKLTDIANKLERGEL